MPIVTKKDDQDLSVIPRACSTQLRQQITGMHHQHWFRPSSHAFQGIEWADGTRSTEKVAPDEQPLICLLLQQLTRLQSVNKDAGQLGYLMPPSITAAY